MKTHIINRLHLVAVYRMRVNLVVGSCCDPIDSPCDTCAIIRCHLGSLANLEVAVTSASIRRPILIYRCIGLVKQETTAIEVRPESAIINDVLYMMSALHTIDVSGRRVKESISVWNGNSNLRGATSNISIRPSLHSVPTLGTHQR